MLSTKNGYHLDLRAFVSLGVLSCLVTALAKAMVT